MQIEQKETAMLRVYLADLVHNSTVLANDCMPLNIGYIKAVLDRDLGTAGETQLFKYPEHLEGVLRTQAPDVLMLSNYVWNEALSLAFARTMKAIRPTTLVVMGGPNLPLERELRARFVEQHPEIDFFIVGEGEFTSLDLLQQYDNAGRSIERLKEQAIPYALFVRRDGAVHFGDALPRKRNVDDIPSPWLNGSMDQFFDGKLAPIIETNRGCPFACTFCVQGTDWYTKVNYFELERVKDEIRYIGRQINTRSPGITYLRIADSNFGMFERDVDISREIGRAQKQYDWPRYIDATTGKNQPNRVIAALGEANNAIVMYTSVQSLEPQVLANIKRQNIKLGAYRDIQITVQGRGLRALTELILGLPGETLASHVRAIRDVIDAGSRQITAYQAMLLHGSELGTLQSRARWGMGTHFRVLPRNFGVYCGEKVFEVEEIITSTSTLTFDEYLGARIYHFFVATVINGRQFDPLVRYLERSGVRPSALLDGLVRAEKAKWPVIDELLTAFLDDTRSELFGSREACIAFYSEPENFERLKTGQIGNNLLFKYRALATTHHWSETTQFVFDVAFEVAKEAAADRTDVEQFWMQLRRFVELRVAFGERLEHILEPTKTALQFDFPRWLTDGCPPDVADYREAEDVDFAFALQPSSKDNIERVFATWKGDNLLSMAKLLTRVHAEDFIRDCQRVDAAGS